MGLDPDGMKQYARFRSWDVLRLIVHALAGLGGVGQHRSPMVPASTVSLAA